MIVKELLTVFGFKTDTAGFKGAADAYASLLAKAQALKAVWDNTIGKLQKFADETAVAGDQAAKTAARLGTTAETMQELEFAADRSGVSAQSLAMGMKSLERRAFEATRGNKEFMRGFIQMGVSIFGANGKIKPVDKLLEDIADKMSGMESEGKKTALAMKVMGDGGAALIPMLLAGSNGIKSLRQEARDLGFVMSNEQAASMEVAIDVLTNYNAAWTGIKRTLAFAVIPELNKLRVNSTKAMIGMRDLVRKGAMALAKGLGFLIDMFFKASKFVNDNTGLIKTLAGVLGFGALRSFGFGAAVKFAWTWIKRLGLILFRTILPAALFVAKIVAIAIILEDFIQLVRTGDSGLKRLRDAFVDKAFSPEGTWIGKVIASALNGIVELGLALNRFLTSFTEQVDKVGLGKAIIDAGKKAFDFLYNEFKMLLNRLLREVDNIPLLNRLSKGFAFTVKGDKVDVSGAEPQFNKSAGKFVQQRFISNPQVNVTVPAGTSVEDAQRIAGAAAKEAVDKSAAEFSRDLQPTTVR